MKNNGMMSVGKPGNFGEKSQKLNHGSKQIEEIYHVTNENGACQISCKTCRIVFKTKIFVRIKIA